LGWVNTFLPLIVPSLAGGAFFNFLMVQFIRGIPRDLDEASEIDGASHFNIFWRVIRRYLNEKEIQNLGV